MSSAEGTADDAASRVRKSRVEARSRHRPVGRPRRRYRTIWISDVHLGTRGCNDRMLIDFLDHVDSDTLYLVGDIIDGWRMKKRFYWPERHNAIVRRVMKRAKHGTRVVYIPGNHDEMFRQFAGINFGGVEIRSKAIHVTADGRRLLVLHGDEFDARRARPPLARLPRRRRLRHADAAQHRGERRAPPVRPALLVAVQARQAQGQERGRVHLPLRGGGRARGGAAARSTASSAAISTPPRSASFGDVVYYNDGDWVEGCTALVEHQDGRMEILHWADEIAARAAARPQPTRHGQRPPPDADPASSPTPGSPRSTASCARCRRCARELEAARP